LTVDEPGRLILELAAPRPTPARPRAMVEGVELAALDELDHRPGSLTVAVDDNAAAAGFVELELVSEPYRPAADGHDDPRELGVVLLGLEFEPIRPSNGWWNEPGR
jgi:hypothetical protein